jgi:thymidine phosphorylase
LAEHTVNEAIEEQARQVGETPLHVIDLIRKKRDGGRLDARELAYIVKGAAYESIPAEQLAAWLMAAWIRGLSLEETQALALAMRDS